MPTTREVLDHHLKCLSESDLQGILADYAPDAVLFTPNGPLNGIAAIAPAFAATLQEFGKPGATFDMKHLAVHGEHAYIVWSAETADHVYEMATDTFVIREGKIVAQSFAGKITPKAGARTT
jgi:ketosteroid isomerase-like protein